MASREHVIILLQGVEAWNQWRKENPDTTPDLSGFDIADHAAALAKAGGKLDLTGIDLRKADLEEAKLPGVVLAKADLSEAIMARADLSGAVLVNANLQDAIMEMVRLDRANLHGARLEHAWLMEASLPGAKLNDTKFTGANISFSCLTKASFRMADLGKAELCEAHLGRADLRGAMLHDARLNNAHLQGADLRATDLENADVSGIHFNRRGRYRGIRVATCHGSQAFRRHAMDQDFLEEFRAKSWFNRIVYYFWLVTCDCGRSLLLWAGWSVALALLFAWRFYALGPEAMHIATDGGALPWSFASMCYYSVITFTTLGFGDVTPKTLEAAWWVMAEVILGYVMLGGLISIFANKLARRSG